MARPRKWGSDAERIEYHSKNRKNSRMAEFIAVDGEGTGRGVDHRYVLLGVGDLQIESGGDDVRFADICNHLYTQYQEHPGVVWVGFFLGYDFNRWLRLLPETKARRLFDPSTRQRNLVKCVDKDTGEVTWEDSPLGPWPVTYGGYEFDLLGMRRFKLRPAGSRGGWMYVCDAGPFFQTSLMKAIDPKDWKDPVVSEDEYKILEEGKKKRDVATLDDSMRYYNRLENAVLPRVMERLDRGFRKAGVRLGKDQWFGPGQAAQAWMDGVKCPDGEMVRKAISNNGANRDVLNLGRLAYYGGWFEIFTHGHIPGSAWEYDINSAYPAIIAQLPCLLHGTWESDTTPEIRHDEYSNFASPLGNGRRGIRLVHARVHGTNAVCGAMLHRCEDSSILRPLRTEGWYWEHELAAGMRAGVIDDVDVIDGVTYRPCDCPPPLRGVKGLYEERLRVGKDTPEGKAYKLLYNSMYGKTAQHEGKPKYNNYVWASLITSGCRTMILDAIGTHPEGTNALLMVATDGVYFRNRHPSLPVSSRLGEWGETEKTNLTLFKPGVYWDDDARERIRQDIDPSFKARGISARDFAGYIQDIDDNFSRWKPGKVFPSVKYRSSFSMTTCKQALQRGKWDTAGTISTLEVTQDSDPSTKRSGPLHLDTTNGGHGSGIWRSQPYQEMDPISSSPYREEAPGMDREQYGITDDGTVEDSWRLN